LAVDAVVVGVVAVVVVVVLRTALGRAARTDDAAPASSIRDAAPSRRAIRLTPPR
jgi:hypothetical protein